MRSDNLLIMSVYLEIERHFTSAIKPCIFSFRICYETETVDMFDWPHARMCQDLAKCEINNFMNDVAAWTWEKSLEERVCFCYLHGLSTVNPFWNTSYHRGTLYCRGFNGERAELLLIYKQHKQLQSLQKCGPLAVEGEAVVRPGAGVRCVTLYHWDTSNVRLA